MTIVRSHMTRLLHLAVLATVVEQLLTSLVMERPLPGESPQWPFALHQQAGLVGLGVLSLFWLCTLIRDERETPLQRLFPWFSREGLDALAADLRAIVSAMARLRRRRCISTRSERRPRPRPAARDLPGDERRSLVRPLYRHILWAYGARGAFAGGKPDVGLSDRARRGGARSTSCAATASSPACSGSGGDGETRRGRRNEDPHHRRRRRRRGLPGSRRRRARPRRRRRAQRPRRSGDGDKRAALRRRHRRPDAARTRWALPGQGDARLRIGNPALFLTSLSASTTASKASMRAATTISSNRSISPS